MLWHGIATQVWFFSIGSSRDWDILKTGIVSFAGRSRWKRHSMFDARCQTRMVSFQQLSPATCPVLMHCCGEESTRWPRVCSRKSKKTKRSAFHLVLFLCCYWVNTVYHCQVFGQDRCSCCLFRTAFCASICHDDHLLKHLQIFDFINDFKTEYFQNSSFNNVHWPQWSENIRIPMECAVTSYGGLWHTFSSAGWCFWSFTVDL